MRTLFAITIAILLSMQCAALAQFSGGGGSGSGSSLARPEVVAMTDNLTLTATPGGYTIVAWAGGADKALTLPDAASSEGMTVVIVSQTNFVCTLNLASPGTDYILNPTGWASGTGKIYNGDVMTLVATPSDGYSDPAWIETSFQSGGMYQSDSANNMLMEPLGGIRLDPSTAPASPATGWVVYVDATGTQLKAKNTGGLVVPVSAGIAGDGSDGAVTLSATGTDTCDPYYATTIATSGTFTRTLIRSWLNATTSITLSANSTLTSTDGYLGGTAQGSASSNGFGAIGGLPASAAYPASLVRGGQGSLTGGVAAGGGGGASCIAAGGDGGGASQSNGGFAGAYWSATAGRPNLQDLAGYGGGSAGTGAGATSGAGGNGGGVIKMYSNGAIDVSAATAVNCVGTAGGNGGVLAGGSGGGAGGAVMLFSRVSNALGTTKISVAGGNGGNGTGASTDGGGGGAGGLVYAMSPSNSGTVTVTAGTGGSAGAGGTAGSNGTDGTYLNVSGTPNLPTVAFVEDGRGIRGAIAMDRAVRWMRGQEINGEIKLSQQQQSQRLAAWYAKPGAFKELETALNCGGDGSVAQFAAVDINIPQCVIESESLIRQDAQTCGGFDSDTARREI